MIDPMAAETASPRFKLWIASAEHWTGNKHPFVALNLQMLGHAEQPIMALERQLAETAEMQMSIEKSLILTQCSALSIYWLFGLFEALRTLKQRDPGTFAPAERMFYDISIARMPLAKHEVKQAKGYRQTEHYPTSLWEPRSGRVGWHVFDPRQEKMVTISRTDIADRFLAIGAPTGE